MRFPDNTKACLALVLKIWTFCGLAKLELTPKAPYVKFKTLLPLILGVLQLIIVLWLLIRNYPDSTSFDSCLTYVQFVVINVQCYGIIVNLYRKHKAIVRIVRQVLILDQVFGPVEMRRFKIFFMQYAFVYTFLFIVMIVQIVIFRTEEVIFIHYSVCYCVSSFYNSNFFLLVNLVQLTLLEFYKKLPGLQVEAVKFIKVEVFLRDLSVNFIKVFQNFLFLRVFTDFVIISSGLYYISIYVLLRTYLLDYTIIGLVTALLVSVLFYADFKFIGNFEEIIAQLAQYVETVETYKYKFMDLCYLRVHHRPLFLMVLGLFPLNTGLFYTMVSGIATYLVYSLQFRNLEFHIY